METAFARTVWHGLEALHAVTYFAPESREANREVGLRGFWMGYFAARAAPLGAVAAGVVEAAFFNFHPAMVRRAIPSAWEFAAPEAVLHARQKAAAAALRRIAPAVGETAVELLPLLGRTIAAADGAGRSLFAANRGLPTPDDHVSALWQAATALREHRGDGHVALLTAEGLNGCEAHVLFAACRDAPVEILRDNRGWSTQDWQAATSGLTARGLLKNGHPTSEGRALHTHVEVRTDSLAAVPYLALTQSEADRLLGSLSVLADQVFTSGTIPFPNPMGLPSR
ncbi:hypothetical protein [Streptomyces sp. NPDC127084]|uniref:SCO6745 family protein n=1 Tax=Streptomyces sp. NPDC127084 TaxID=3347133 RepID=UPI0036507FFB